MEVPWQVLEKELLEKERIRQKLMLKKWFIKGISRGFFYAFITLVIILLIFLIIDVYIRLEFVLFMESGLFFLIGGMVGTQKTSISMNRMINTLLGTNFHQDGKTHEEGTHTVIYFSIVAVTLSVLSLIAFFFDDILADFLFTL